MSKILNSSNRKLTILIGLVAALLISGGAYAFTASNTVPASTAGSGAGAGKDRVTALSSSICIKGPNNGASYSASTAV